MLKHFPILAVAVVLIAGCAHTQPASQTQAAYPAWVLKPDKPGLVGAVGAAPKQDSGGREAQYRVAQMKAYQVLAHMQRVEVTSTNRSFLEERSGKVVRNDDIETSLKSNVALRVSEAKVIEEWVDPKTGELYLWMVVPE
jgi:hypothetical protein